MSAAQAGQALPAVYAAPTARTAPAPASGSDGLVQRYYSRPDLVPPAMAIDLKTAPLSPGLMLLTPKATTNEQLGPMLIDDTGSPVWFAPRGDKLRLVMNAQQQTYKGKPVIMWWEGSWVPLGWGMGHVVIADDHYRTIAQVGMDDSIDLHAIKITPENTLLAVSYHTTSVVDGRPTLRPIVECTIREIDIASGKVLTTWNSLDHIPVTESYLRSNELMGWDYLHFNAIDLDANGNIVVSGRNTHTIYTIDRHSGQILSRLGGRFSDYKLTPDAEFAWQHNVRYQPGGFSMFDNEAAAAFPSVPPSRPASRAILLHVDEATKTATLARSVSTVDGLSTGTQGSNQLLPDGHDLVNWGDTGRLSEFDENNQLIFAAHFTGPTVNTYVANHVDWHGTPTDPPAVAAYGNAQGVAVYASWNGATELRRWQLLTGNDRNHLKVVTTADRSGFETMVTAAGAAKYAQVRALDANGRVLGSSAVVSVTPA
ncbi:arylsulfotransferase family protein [Actinokineospora enzanensis]|uniref:arylsulfotransferase family protein n=1 Tax=Actinokineospora enzanensis TaxID=155975 RepID=UPI00037E5A52|nr:arylsulfotransferase family protein [Actinokineospora enzanensis]